MSISALFHSTSYKIPKKSNVNITVVSINVTNHKCLHLELQYFLFVFVSLLNIVNKMIEKQYVIVKHSIFSVYILST